MELRFAARKRMPYRPYVAALVGEERGVPVHVMFKSYKAANNALRKSGGRVKVVPVVLH